MIPTKKGERFTYGSGYGRSTYIFHSKDKITGDLLAVSLEHPHQKFRFTPEMFAKINLPHNPSL